MRCHTRLANLPTPMGLTPAADGGVPQRGYATLRGGASMYREFAAPPELGRYIQCFWLHAVRPDAPACVHRILPDGCIDIISGLSAEPTVVGPMTRHALISIAPGTVIVGARFKPGLAPALLRCPSPELLDLEPPLSEVWSRQA